MNQVRSLCLYAGGLMLALTLFVPLSAAADTCPRVNESMIMCRMSEYVYMKRLDPTQNSVKGTSAVMAAIEAASTTMTRAHRPSTLTSTSTRAQIDTQLHIIALKSEINRLTTRLLLLQIAAQRGQ